MWQALLESGYCMIMNTPHDPTRQTVPPLDSFSENDRTLSEWTEDHEATLCDISHGRTQFVSKRGRLRYATGSQVSFYDRCYFLSIVTSPCHDPAKNQPVRPLSDP